MAWATRAERSHAMAHTNTFGFRLATDQNGVLLEVDETVSNRVVRVRRLFFGHLRWEIEFNDDGTITLSETMSNGEVIKQHLVPTQPLE